MCRNTVRCARSRVAARQRWAPPWLSVTPVAASPYATIPARNRHCPKCQTLAKERWLAARSAELLAVPYFHVVFTLPHALNALAQGNPRILYKLLFNAAAETLQRFGRDPQWLGGELGVTMVLHTWTQTLTQHLHVHCLVTAGALTHEGQWQPAQARLPVSGTRALTRVSR